MAKRCYGIWVLRRTPVGGSVQIMLRGQGLAWSKDEAWRLAVLEGYFQGSFRWRRPKADPGVWHLRYRGQLVGTVRPLTSANCRTVEVGGS